MQEQFISQVVEKVKQDHEIIGLAVAGSYITKEIDEYSDVDLILVTKNKIAPDAQKMITYAKTLGDYISGFTGEHVGEIRVLICLYDNPLLHVDIKFLTLEEFNERVEDPVILFDRDQALEKIISTTKSEWPKLDYQWIEDRFWTWVHYAALKLGRGEYFEALDFLSFIRMMVTAPMLQVKNGNLPRGLRKVEIKLKQQDLNKLIDTVPQYKIESIIKALEQSIQLYQELRADLFPASIQYQKLAEERVLEYLKSIKTKRLDN